MQKKKNGGNDTIGKMLELEFNSQAPFGKGESAKLSSTFVFAESGRVLIDYAIQK